MSGTRTNNTGDPFGDDVIHSSTSPNTFPSDPTHAQGTFTNSQPSAQHVHHDSSDLLPGARGTRDPVDYSAGRFEHESAPDIIRDDQYNQRDSTLTGQQRFGSSGANNTMSTQGQTLSHSDRPMNTQLAREGGVAVDAPADIAEGRPGFGDKVVGKTQKVMGKATNNPSLHEKGELRETSGRAAAEELARAPHH